MKSSFRRGVIAALFTALAGSGLMAVTSGSPAQAGILTNYGFQTAAYGSWVKTGPAGVTSGKTAWSILACTRETGHSKDIGVLAGPTIAGSLDVSGVRSKSYTYRDAHKNVGTRSSSTVAKVVLGDPNGLNITVEALTTRANAWASPDGKLHARKKFTSAGISANTGTPLDDILNLPGATIGDLLEQIAEATGGVLEIPGIGELRLGFTKIVRGTHFVKAVATALEVRIDTPDSPTVIRIGHAVARVNKDLPAGVFHGFAYPLDAHLLEGTLDLRSRPAGRPMPCRGTNGNILESAAAGGDVLNAGAVGLGVVSGRVFGIQHDDGSARGWTEGRIAEVNIGGGAIVIKGIVGKANVRQTRRGEIRKNAIGTQIASLVINGEEHGIPDPGQAIEVPGVAKLTFFVKNRLRRGIEVTAVRVELLMDTPLQSTVRLGWAKTVITKS